MEIINTLLLIFLEMTFIFVALLLLFSQRKSIGDIPFYITLGMLLIFGEFMVGAQLNFSGMEKWVFPVAPVVIFVPFMAAVLLIYITDGVLSFQRLIIGSLATMGVFFYLGDLTRLQVRWITHSVSGRLPLESFDSLLELTRSGMLAVVAGQLLALFIMPVAFSRLRNAGHRMLVCCCGSLTVALLVDTLVYELLTVGNWQEISRTLLPTLAVRLLSGIYLACLLTLYVVKIGRESEAKHVRALEIIFAFFGSYSRSKLLEANLMEWEGRYRVILENASEMIVVVDRNGKILDANRAAGKMLDSTALTGRNFDSFLNKYDTDIFRQNLQKSRDTSSGSGQFYVELAREETDPEAISGNLQLALTVTPLSIGALEALVVMGRDITEERSLEAEKQRLNEELVHSQRLEALGQLAGGVAHDFNNNIHAILGHADLIALRGELGEKSNNHLGKIIEIAESSGQLTSQLLGFARKGKYRESDFDLRVLIQRTAELFLPGSKDIEFSVKTADKPLLVRGDQIQ
ncbi:MAG: PAS domain S-box protein, partial [Lentisphaerae bacterium]|nr:PAS domain S-box protein [Lentisphaerota bacterium]